MKPSKSIWAHIKISVLKIPRQHAVRVRSHDNKARVISSQITGFLILLVIALSGFRAHATVIVVLATGDRIVIAADSRQGLSNDLLIDGGVTVSDSACKVWMLGRAAFAASGNVAQEGFHDVRTIAPSALAQPGLSVDKYRWAAAALQAQRMQGYPPSKVVLILAAFEPRRGPSISAGEIPLPLLWAGEPQFNCVGGAECTKVIIATPEQAVDTVAVDARIKQRPTEKEMITLARLLVHEQAKTTPLTVGGPTDVLVLDAKGGRWIELKPNCKQDHR